MLHKNHYNFFAAKRLVFQHRPEKSKETPEAKAAEPKVKEKEKVKTLSAGERAMLRYKTDARVTGKREHARPDALPGREKKEVYNASLKRIEAEFIDEKIAWEKPYSKAEVEVLAQTNFKLDPEIHKRWTDLDVSNPDDFVHFQGIVRVQNALRGDGKNRPFNWGLGDLHKAIKGGAFNSDEVVDFDDLVDSSGLGLGDNDNVADEYNKLSVHATQYFEIKHQRDRANHEIPKLEEKLKDPSIKGKARTALQIKLNEYKHTLKSTQKRFEIAKKQYEKVQKRFELLHNAFRQAEEILESLRSYNFYYDPRKTVEIKAESPIKLEYTKAEFDALPPYQRVGAYLNKVFDRNHIGEKMVDSNKIFDLAAFGGSSRTEFNEEMWKNYITGRAAFYNTRKMVIEAADETNESVADKTIKTLNAYIRIGNIYSEKLWNKKIEAKPLSEKDFNNFKVTQKQIEAAQLGASVEFALRAKLEKATFKIKNPALKEVAKKYFLLNPELGDKDRAEVVRGLNKIDVTDIGTFLAGVHTKNFDKIAGGGIGYARNFPIAKGLSLTVTAVLGRHEDKGTGLIIGAGISKTKDLGVTRLKGGVGVLAGLGVTDDGDLILGAQAGIEGEISWKASEAYNIFGLSAFAEAGTGGVGAGVGLTLVEYDKERHKRSLKQEFNRAIGIDKAEKIISGEGTVEQKLAKLEKISEVFGPIVAEITKAFTDLQEVLKKKVTPEMKQHILRLSLRVLKEQSDLYFTENVWGKNIKSLNRLGFKLDLNINVAQSIFRGLAGIISFNYHKKSHVLPIFAGKRQDAVKDLTEMADAFRTYLHKERKEFKNIKAKDIKVEAPARLGDNGFVVMVETPEGVIEGRVLYDDTYKVDFGKVEYQLKDESYKVLREGFQKHNIEIKRDPKEKGAFIIDIKGAKMTELDLTNTNIFFQTDKKFREYIDVVKVPGKKANTRFKIRFRKEYIDSEGVKHKLKRPENLFISRVDLSTPKKFHGADQQVFIMLKSDLTPDYILEKQNKHTALAQYVNYETFETGDEVTGIINNLYKDPARYRKIASKYKYENWLFDKSDRAELIRRKQAEYAARRAKRAALSKKVLEAVGQKIEKPKVNIRDFVLEVGTKLRNFKALTTQVKRRGTLTKRQADQAFRLLSRYAKKKGIKITDTELTRAVGMLPALYFTRLTKYIKARNIPAIKSTLKRRLKLFLRLTKDILADSRYIKEKQKKDPKILDKVMVFLETRWTAKIDAVNEKTNFSSLTRDHLKRTPHIGVLTRGPGGKGKGTIEGLADLDGAYLGKGFEGEFTGFGMEELDLNSSNPLEKAAAAAILQTEHDNALAYLNEEGDPTKEFFNQPLTLQVLLQSPAFMEPKQIETILKIKETLKVEESQEEVWKLFGDTIDFVRGKQVEHSNSDKPITLDAPGGKAKMVIYPIKIRDFFFEACGNISWAVGGGVQFVPADVIEEEYLKPMRVVGTGRHEHGEVYDRAIARMGTVGIGLWWTNEMVVDETEEKPKESPGRVEEPEDNKGRGDGGAKAPGGEDTGIDIDFGEDAAPVSPNARRTPASPPPSPDDTGGGTAPAGGDTGVDLDLP